MNSQHIGKLLPADGYQLRMRAVLPEAYSAALTHLYQPLLGIRAVTLYQTLVNDYFLHHGKCEPQTHHMLMTLLDMPMDQLYEARLQLEAIGLIRTYQNLGNRTCTHMICMHHFHQMHFSKMICCPSCCITN